MKRIIAKRQTGKTTKLIRLANGSGGIILVHDLNAVRNTIELAKKMNCNNVAVSTYEDFLMGNRVKEVYAKTKGIYVDNADLFMKYLFDEHLGIKLNGFTIEDTSDDMSEIEEKHCDGKCPNCMCKDRLF